MGLTASSTGSQIDTGELMIKDRQKGDKIMALAGNPNVGKSTLFNLLTGMHQHTGNWPGKTVTNAQGRTTTPNNQYIVVDMPGTYSLMAHSVEEEVARNFICFGQSDVTVVVCDGTCLERNLNLVLQTMEISPRTVVCVNLLDEARRKGIAIDLQRLEQKLGVPVVGVVAREKDSVEKLMAVVDAVVEGEYPLDPIRIPYPKVIRNLIDPLAHALAQVRPECPSQWLALKLLDEDASLMVEIEKAYGKDFLKGEVVAKALWEAIAKREELTLQKYRDILVSVLVLCGEDLCIDVVSYGKPAKQQLDNKIDRLLTSKIVGYPLMVILLLLVFWLTITGANVPSALLSDLLFGIEEYLTTLCIVNHVPSWLHGVVVLGAYRVLAWVVSVMLPPMAIFFPLFTILEDVGYLPRVAYNLDHSFQKCKACGKQALTMCMGFGCNAAGVIGCRIITSPRERLLAILTNSFVPCNGRFPTLIAIITMFFVGSGGGWWVSFQSAVLLTAMIVLSIFLTFVVTKVLSMTILKGVPSSFVLELPPYRKPQFGSVIVRSIFDRTLFVLGRAVTVAIPTGCIIWLLANTMIGDSSILNQCTSFLDPFAQLMGLDGVILMAFILGLPANEIVLPLIIMTYTASGALVEMDSLTELRVLLIDNGWTWVTALNTMLFSLLHWPCSTTLLTIKEETGSWKWTILALLLPTVCGIVGCICIGAIF